MQNTQGCNCGPLTNSVVYTLAILDGTFHFVFYFRMSARGRRRLRLSSRKHYERDKYRKKKAIAAKLAAEDIDSTCKLSIPLMVINQAPSKTIEGLHNRLKIMQAIPDG